MDFSQIKEAVIEIAAEYKYTEVLSVVNNTNESKSVHPIDFVVHAAKAVGEPSYLLPVAAANFCLLASIHLVDDMLDEETTGLYRIVGGGATANMALAFQSIASQLIYRSALALDKKDVILNSFSAMMIQTAVAQQQEKQVSFDQQVYWNNAANKSAPLFRSALFSGAIAAGATVEKAHQLASLGTYFGLIIQIGDDISDVFKENITPDWRSPSSNLLLLYMHVADYPEKTFFQKKLSCITGTNELKKLQELMIQSGALSYAVYQLNKYEEIIRNRLMDMDLQYKTPILHLINQLTEPVKRLMAS